MSIKIIVNFIVSFLNKMWYDIKQKKLKTKLDKERKEADEIAKKANDRFYDFKFKLDEYRKRPDLRSTIDRVRESSRDPGPSNKREE